VVCILSNKQTCHGCFNEVINKLVMGASKNPRKTRALSPSLSLSQYMSMMCVCIYIYIFCMCMYIYIYVLHVYVYIYIFCTRALSLLFSLSLSLSLYIYIYILSVCSGSHASLFEDIRYRYVSIRQHSSGCLPW
jgi:hypothetical protein